MSVIVFGIGGAIGESVGNIISDKFGRKWVHITGFIVIIISGSITAAAQNYETYSALVFFSSLANAVSICHCSDVRMGTIASQITSLTIVSSIVYSGADQRKHQSSASLVFVRGIHRWPVNSPHKGSVTRKMFPFGDVIMVSFLLPVNTLKIFG